MLRKALRNLMSLDDPPERTALAFAVGVSIAFSPLLGLHTIIAVVISIICRLSKPAVIIGSYINNPWTIAPIIGASWGIGKWIIGAPPVSLPGAGLSSMMSGEFWSMLRAQWRQLMPFAMGAITLSFICGFVSYPIMLYILRAYRRRTFLKTENARARETNEIR